MYVFSKASKPLFLLVAALVFLFVPSKSYADPATDIMEEASYSPDERLYEGKPCNLTAEWVVLPAAELNNYFQEPYLNWWYQKPLTEEELAWIKDHAISDHDLTLKTEVGLLNKYSTDNAELEGMISPRNRHMNESFMTFRSVLMDHTDNIGGILRPDTPTIVQNVDNPDQTKVLLILRFSL